MAIYGIGTDLCNISRVGKAAENRRFVEKILHPLEVVEYERRAARHQRQAIRFLASRFAAKEALSKAMGTGFRAPMAWHGCSVLPDAQGKPVAQCYGDLQVWMEERGLQVHVSLSDEVEYCLAFCILEQNT